MWSGEAAALGHPRSQVHTFGHVHSASGGDRTGSRTGRPVVNSIFDLAEALVALRERELLSLDAGVAGAANSVPRLLTWREHTLSAERSTDVPALV